MRSRSDSFFFWCFQEFYLISHLYELPKFFQLIQCCHIENISQDLNKKIVLHLNRIFLMLLSQKLMSYAFLLLYSFILFVLLKAIKIRMFWNK